MHDEKDDGVRIPRQDRVRVVVSDFEENLDKSSFQDPRDYAIANARGKAREVKTACVFMVEYSATFITDSGLVMTYGLDSSRK